MRVKALPNNIGWFIASLRYFYLDLDMFFDPDMVISEVNVLWNLKIVKLVKTKQAIKMHNCGNWTARIAEEVVSTLNGNYYLRNYFSATKKNAKQRR